MSGPEIEQMRADMSGILRGNVSQTLAVTDLSGLLMRENPDARKLELAAQRLAQAANDTRIGAQNLLAAAQDLQKQDLQQGV